MAAPTVDGHANNKFSGASSGTVTLTTSNANDVIVVVVGFEEPSNLRSVSSVTASGLTFTKRGAAHTGTWSNGRNNAVCEVWWAPAASALSAKVITVTLSGAIDCAALVAFGVSGCYDINAPWDDNVSLPAFTVGTGPLNADGATAPVISTSEANDLLIGGTLFNINAHETSTWTLVDQVSNLSGTFYAYMDVFSNGVTVAQSSLSVPFTSTSNDRAVRWADALTADAPTPPPSTWVPRVIGPF